jgi:proteic killer suppression protein
VTASGADTGFSTGQAFERTALRRLAFLNQIRSLDDLKSPGFRLEAPRADRAGQYSVRINDRWRVCFRRQDGDVTDVEIVDYH